MKRFKMSKSKAIATMKKQKMDLSFLKKESVNEATGVHIKLVDSITRLILSGRNDKIAYDRLKMMLKQRDPLVSSKESTGVYNQIYKELYNGLYSAISKVRRKYKLEPVKESIIINGKKYKSLNESDQSWAKYYSWRNDKSMTPKQKIGMSMREVRDSLQGLERIINRNIKLKKELKVGSNNYWKSTHSALRRIHERLVKLTGKIASLY